MAAIDVPDLNLWLALIDPDHAHHARARRRHPTATTNASRGPRSAGCDANTSFAGSLRCSRRILWPDAQGILPSDWFGAVLKNRMSAVLFWTLCGSVRSAAA